MCDGRSAKRVIIYLNECTRAMHKGERGYLGDHIPAGSSNLTNKVAVFQPVFLSWHDRYDWDLPEVCLLLIIPEL